MKSFTRKAKKTEIYSESEEGDHSEEYYSDNHEGISGSEQGYSDDESDNNETMDALKEELAEIPFEKLLEIQNKVGYKKFNDVINKKPGSDKEKTPTSKKFDSKDTRPKLKDLKKKSSKKQPTVESARKPVGRYRNIVQAKKVSRDPRFDALSGSFNEDLFSKSYSFIKDYQDSEMNMLKDSLSKARKSNPNEAQRLEKVINQMESRNQAKKQKDHRKELERKHKKKEMELTKMGKKPYFLKKSTLKEIELAEKFAKIKDSKKLDNLLEKRRKHNAAKEHRHMPYKRHQASERQ
ncbi:rRNA biogenesis protein rrp36 [Mycoemilia scoparia]|uniref:rRNA biogenesis protein RRP36 n=1 Tax=Mycoemilia scoparia TaxID=417184 RepID=A0A9W8DTQ2_9FUNG|nr:rRNA biogenesis protein rrp36 [Mycoemilia scoparia]